MQSTVKRDREKYIGGSDVPSVMGVSPWTSRYEMLMQKAGIAVSDFEGNEYTRYGDEMEPKIRDYVNKSMKANFIECMRVFVDAPIGRRYHADGYDEESKTVLEIKTTSAICNKAGDYKVYMPQLLFGMDMFGCESGLLAVYERPKDFNAEFDEKRLHLYPVEMSAFTDLHEAIERAFDSFKEDLKALKNNPFLPENELPSMKQVEPAAMYVEQLELQLVSFKALQEKYEDAKESLRSAMEKNGVKSWVTPRGIRFSFVPAGQEKEVEKFDDKKFAEDHPRLWKQYQRKSVRKGAKSYVRVTMPKEVIGD